MNNNNWVYLTTHEDLTVGMNFLFCYSYEVQNNGRRQRCSHYYMNELYFDDYFYSLSCITYINVKTCCCCNVFCLQRLACRMIFVVLCLSLARWVDVKELPLLVTLLTLIVFLFAVTEVFVVFLQQVCELTRNVFSYVDLRYSH